MLRIVCPLNTLETNRFFGLAKILNRNYFGGLILFIENLDFLTIFNVPKLSLSNGPIVGFACELSYA